MPLVKQLSQIGNSRGVILDRTLLAQADIDPNGEVEIAVRDGAIVITPHRYASDSEFKASARKVFTERKKMLRPSRNRLQIRALCEGVMVHIRRRNKF